MIMTDNELQLLVEKVSIEVFKKPFTHKAEMNKRLRSTGGRYLLSTHAIEINPLVYEVYGIEELIGVVKHELCHYHLHLEGKGYQHRDVDFRSLMKETNSPRHCKPLQPRTSKIRIVRMYQCLSCNHRYSRKRRMDPLKYRCGRCEGLIVEVTS